MPKKTVEKLETSILDRVGEFLDNDEKISTRTGLQLLVEMQSEQYKKTNEVIELLQANSERITALETEQAELRRTNIVLWIKEHPKGALIAFVAFLALNAAFDWSVLVRPLLFGVGKWLGFDIR